MTETNIILGPPGTGKTTRLLQVMETEMAAGVAPDRIAFVSFTRKAAREATERACTKFKFTVKDVPYFRTLHSLAFKQLQLNKDSDVMRPAHWKELGEILGVTFTGELGAGDKLLRVHDLARSKLAELKRAWQLLRPVDATDWWRVEHFAKTFLYYKQQNLLWDFTDMLERYEEECLPIPVEVAIIDEAQDLSSLQWRMADYALSQADRVYIAGDDDQAIFRWAGADLNRFLSLSGSREVLQQSYRLPRKIWDVSAGSVAHIKQRYEKHWNPRSEDGAVTWTVGLTELMDVMREGTWMILHRNVYRLAASATAIRQAGLPYTLQKSSAVKANHVTAILGWERLTAGRDIDSTQAQHVLDQFKRGVAYTGQPILPKERPTWTLVQLREEVGLKVTEKHWYDVFDDMDQRNVEYYRSCMRNGEDLREQPRIHIDTIHGVKGGEADNVVLFTDITRRIKRESDISSDDEWRVWFVGLTRARHNLYLVAPQTGLYQRIN